MAGYRHALAELPRGWAKNPHSTHHTWGQVMVGWGQLFASRLGITPATVVQAVAARDSSPRDGEQPSDEVISLEECRRLLQETARELQASGRSAADLRRSSTRRRIVHLDFEPFDEPT